MVPIIQNYIDMLVSIPLKMSVLGFMKYLTGESAQMIFQKRGNMHTEISNFDVREITLTPWRKIEKLYKITNQINKREIKKAVN